MLIVLVAIYVKTQEAEGAELFRMEDAYIIVGAFLGMVVLRFWFGGRQNGKTPKSKDK